MIERQELRKLAQARLDDAKVLLEAGRYDGAFYISGYVVELALKTRICETLNWESFPQTRGEFQSLTSFKTHDLDILLHLSGVEQEIKTEFFTAWSAVTEWDPETRYNLIGTATKAYATRLVESSEVILRAL